MATVIPRIPQDYHGSPGESEAILALRHLPQEYYVFHSLRWLGNTHHETQGEADLVVFHPRKGFLVIEVKSGGIRFEDGVWFQRNRNTNIEKPIADPMAQSERSRFALLNKVALVLPRGEACLHGHAVWFTSVHRKDLRFPPNYTTEVTFDSKDLEAPLKAIERAFAFWSSKHAYVGAHRLSPAGVGLLLQALAPAFNAAPSLRATIEERDAAMVRLTAEQARILDFLEEQQTAAICGPAGTGKTFIAWAKAERLAAKGDLVLFLCYNAALKDFLRSRNTAPTLHVHSFHSLALKTVGLSESAASGSPDFHQIEARFLDHIAGTELTYQHILIDEAQDFEDRWLAALQENHLARGVFYAFFDRNQLINQDEFPATLDRLQCRLALDTNCRNTRQVADTSTAFLTNTSRHPSRALDGPKTSLHLLGPAEDHIPPARALLADLTKKHAFRLEDIAVLAFDPDSVRAFLASPISRALALAETLRPGAICCTTIRRFKGLEAKVIVLLDATPARLQAPGGTLEFYVASSRAMHELHVFLAANDDQIEDFMVWACRQHDRHLKKDRNGLEKLFNARIKP